MNRIFGKSKEKAPPPDMSAVIKGVNIKLLLLYTVKLYV